MTPPFLHMTIAGLAPRLARREITSRELTEGCLAAIAERNGELRAFITVLADESLAQADAADAAADAGRWLGPLHGIPLSLKDLLDLEGVPTTAASRVRASHRALADAPIVARLRAAGAVFIGKCNLHEFAFGTTSEDSAYGAVRHPADPSRSPGGSSGGSAVAIVTGMSVASIGTDTGGSIRIPSAACGVVGLKPTFAELSCEGVVPLSRTLDHVGPLARSVSDAWVLYLVMRGDPAAAAWPLPARGRIQGLTLGVPRRYFFDVLESDVRARIEEALDSLEAAGARLVTVDIPHASDIAAVYLHAQLPEAAAYHAETIAERPEDYTPNVRLRIELARYVLGEDYVRAQEGREVLRRDVDRALGQCDALALPTLPIPAPPIGASVVPVEDREEPVRNLMLRLTQLFNLTGHPAISLPCGLTRAGLPCGLQLAGRMHETEHLLAAAGACEAALGG
jgi:aspartyl-tRNA(Asn)/glutamyl-tRNA(Gln) amidotransferase subunit A